MLTFKSLGKLGRLGNQMFQIASTIGIAKRNAVDYCFPHWEYKDFFCKSLPYKNIEINQKLMEGKSDFRYVNLSENPNHTENHNYNLFGYLQSYKYFEECKDDVLSYFELKEEYLNYIKSKYTNTHNQTSIHVRRTDYVTLQNFHVLLNMEFYRKAIETVGKDNEFLIFSDDIDWCKENFKDYNCQYVEERPHDININSTPQDANWSGGMLCPKELDSLKYRKEDVIELFLMSMCKNNIIANSSFSWWAAYINKNEEKKVVCPSHWFMPARIQQTYVDVHGYMDHRVPQDWIRI